MGRDNGAMMDKLKFKEEDFYSRNFFQHFAGSEISGKLIYVRDAAQYAQELFDKWLESQTKVYSKQNKDFWHPEQINPLGRFDTHTARLVDIQEIKKEKCEHEPFVNNDPGRYGVFINYGPNMSCHKCGVRLKATFTEAD